MKLIGILALLTGCAMPSISVQNQAPPAPLPQTRAEIVSALEHADPVFYFKWEF